MNELSAALDRVQSSTEEYLNTKSSEAMEDYYRSEQEFRRQIEELNTLVTDDVLLLTEKEYPRAVGKLPVSYGGYYPGKKGKKCGAVREPL